MKKHKYIFVIGGVMSGVGKGITTSSIGTIFEAKGYKVNIIKADPYLNVDAGTMNPTEHGEVFVLDSGLETDQDMGNYERFLDRTLSETDYVTSGMVYKTVIERERSLGYKGKCVEAIPNIRDEIVDRFIGSAKKNKSDISIIEIGGTVGDYQNIMFIEAARMLKLKDPDNVLFIMVSFLPVPGKLGEMKSKPTQNAIRQLQSYGVQAEIIIARSEIPLDKRRKEKIALSCNVPIDNVISAPDIESIYDVPINFEKDKLGEMISHALRLPKRQLNLSKWKEFVKKTKRVKKKVNIAVVGKYFSTGDFILSDAYVSVIEAVKFSSYYNNVKPVLHWVNAQDFEGKSPIALKNILNEKLKDMQGILVPGGFGETGIEGKINVIKYARENKIPYFGLCYGMQLMVIEYARHVAGLKDAHTVEINPKTKFPVIDIMEHQKKLIADGSYGGSMRLGGYPCILKKGSVAEKAYRAAFARNSASRSAAFASAEATASRRKPFDGKIRERHRHRYEVNPNFSNHLIAKGLVFSGVSPDHTLVEIAELPQSEHPFFLGTQFHPEFLARPLSPHPLFTEFIKAASKHDASMIQKERIHPIVKNAIKNGVKGRELKTTLKIKHSGVLARRQEN